MPSKIPSISDYYFHNGQYILKSKFAKYFRYGLMVGLTIGFFLPLTTSSYFVQHSITKPSIKEVVYTEYIEKQNKDLSRGEQFEIVKSIVHWAKEFDVDEKMLLAIARQESTFDKYSISGAGAMGLMQVIPSWHLDKIKSAKNNLSTPEIFDVNTNVYIGTWVFKDCLNKHKDVSKSLNCYNGSLTKPNGYDKKVLNHYEQIKSELKGKFL